MLHFYIFTSCPLRSGSLAPKAEPTHNSSGWVWRIEYSPGYILEAGLPHEWHLICVCMCVCMCVPNQYYKVVCSRCFIWCQRIHDSFFVSKWQYSRWIYWLRRHLADVPFLPPPLNTPGSIKTDIEFQQHWTLGISNNELPHTGKNFRNHNTDGAELTNH